MSLCISLLAAFRLIGLEMAFWGLHERRFKATGSVVPGG